MEEIYKNYGFIYNDRRGTWTRGSFQITEWSDEYIYVTAFADEDDWNIHPTKCKAPQSEQDLKDLFRILTGNELTESGFTLSI